MPNPPNPFFLLTTEHLIFLIFNGIYYYIESVADLGGGMGGCIPPPA